MNHAKLLDCTLRDGAYLVDKTFGDATISGIIAGLVDANIDLIEIGFLQNDGFGEGKTVFKNAAEAKKFIPDHKGKSEFTVLADYSRYDISNLDQCDHTSFEAVRACFFKKERFEVIDFCKEIKKKGYKLFVQPVDILGYSDAEIIEFINIINELEPYCVSIVDTFGSMYSDDLHRVFSLIDHNLTPVSKIGFHSHNNLQMSNALSQEFLKITMGRRKVVVDTTVSGMGRGAGNTPTELVAQYMTDKLGYSYNIDAILDLIDVYMEHIRSICSWGYSTSYFIAGSYSAHVNNISYLKEKNSIQSKDIRYILNKIGSAKRKRYDYDLLEATYMDYLKSDIDDTEAMEKLYKQLSGRNIVVLVPGQTIETKRKIIREAIEERNAVVISVNFIHKNIKTDYLYMSNMKRYAYWSKREEFNTIPKIFTSNIQSDGQNSITVSFNRLIKCGWENMDNSTILLLRLLDQLNVKSIGVAGFDGYYYKKESMKNYFDNDMEVSTVYEDPINLNKSIKLMLDDYFQTRENEIPIDFITPSRFDKENPIN